MRGFIGALLVALPLALVTVAATGQEKPGGNPEAAKVKNPVAATPESIAAGETIYARRCRGCHGKEGTGGPPKEANDRPASNLVDAQWDHGSTDGEIFDTIRNGVPPQFVMEPWDDRISETDTWNVVNYVRSLAKK
jgi:mono/diheme cytochrome c family protein